MKRCVCISCFDHYSTRMQAVCNYFKGKGYDVKYLYASYDHFAKKNNVNRYKEGIKVIVPQYKRNLSPARLYSHMVFSNGVSKFIKKYKPDVIYCMFPPNSLVKAVAEYRKKNKDTRLIFDCYDMWPESFPYSKYDFILKYPFEIWRRLRKNYVAYSDLVIAVSEQGIQGIKPELKGNLVKVIKPVISLGKIPEYKSSVEELTFCYLGMVNHITDSELGIKILGEIAKIRKVSLHIIGEGQNLENFVRRLEEVNVKVVCHGVIFDMEKKNEIFSLCNMGLNIPREEICSTMSLKAVEYLRAGIPFLNNALGDIRSIVEEDYVGINIDKENINKVVKKVLELKENDLIRMHENCIQTYNNQFLEQNYDEIFETII